LAIDTKNSGYAKVKAQHVVVCKKGGISAKKIKEILEE
tara:strand:+ start:25 stop:138 length:114 start_codon:yes stop_codon:yes gene_type:complete